MKPNEKEVPSALARALQRAEESLPDTQLVQFDTTTLVRLCQKARGVFLKHLAKGHTGGETLVMLAAMLRIVQVSDNVEQAEVDRLIHDCRKILEPFILPNPKAQQSNN
jgi:hypothetical protein